MRDTYRRRMLLLLLPRSAASLSVRRCSHLCVSLCLLNACSCSTSFAANSGAVSLESPTGVVFAAGSARQNDPLRSATEILSQSR